MKIKNADLCAVARKIAEVRARKTGAPADRLYDVMQAAAYRLRDERLPDDGLTAAILIDVLEDACVWAEYAWAPAAP